MIAEKAHQQKERACCKMQVLLHTKGTAVGAGLALPGRENESLSEKVGRIHKPLPYDAIWTYCSVFCILQQPLFSSLFRLRRGAVQDPQAPVQPPAGGLLPFHGSGQHQIIPQRR